jgi:hypothetical protein
LPSLGETKLRINGQVAGASPGFGIGLRFTEVSAESEQFLRQHLLSMV